MEQVMRFEGPKRTLFGPGAVRELAEVCRSLGAARVLLVVDRSLAASEAVTGIAGSLEKGRVKAVPYFEITPEPSPDLADRGAALAREEKVQAVVGVGGGSTLDVAKAIAVLATNPGRALDYVGLGLVKEPGLPSVMVPTTAGTGSEATFTAVFTMRESRSKGGINSPFLFPHTAILDPLLTLDLPALVTAYTGMDALTHALESYVSLQASFLSEPLSCAAMERIGESLRPAVYQGRTLQHRTRMLEASYLAGLGLAYAGVGAVHALAYPLGAFFDIPHGLANATLLPYVMAYTLSGSLEKFARIGESLEGPSGGSLREKAARSVDAVRRLSADIGIPGHLRALGIPEDAIPGMAEAAMKVARPLANNPRPLDAVQAAEIYGQAFSGDLRKDV